MSFVPLKKNESASPDPFGMFFFLIETITHRALPRVLFFRSVFGSQQRARSGMPRLRRPAAALPAAQGEPPGRLLRRPAGPVVANEPAPDVPGPAPDSPRLAEEPTGLLSVSSYMPAKTVD